MNRHIATLALSLCFVAGCSGDPETRKAEFIQSGDEFLAAGKVAEAVIQYRNAAQLNETDGEARKKLGQAYTKNGDAPRALEEYVRAADLLPQDLDVQLTAGAYLLLAQRWEDALGRADAALTVDSRSVPGHLLRGNALAGLSSFDDALKAIEEAIRLNPGQGDTFTNLGLVQMARGRREEAEEAFTKAVALSPQSVEGYLALGNFYWSTGRAKETEQAFRSALQAGPDHQLANRAMAALMVATGRYRDAEPYLRRLADSSEDPSAAFALTDYYIAAGRAKDAVGRLEGMVKGGQDSQVVGQRLARAYAAAGDRAKAHELVERVLAGNPAAVDAQLLKGQLLLSEGKREEAFTAIESAAKATPSSAEAQFALGRVYAARGDSAAAEAAFREVLRINPRASAAQLEIARLQLAAGRTADSIKTAEEASRSQPQNVGARLALIRSLLASNDLARAGREITSLRTEQPNLADVHVQAGFLALVRNDIAGARAAFGRAGSLNAGSLDVLSGLIATDLKANDMASAKSRIEARLAQGSTPHLQMLAARTYVAAKDSASAERALRAAIEADPGNLEPYGMLGQLYLTQKKLDQARSEFESLATRQARPIGALTMIGMIHQAQGDNASARKRYEQVLSLDSNAVVAANNLAWMLADAGENLDVALQLAQTAVAASPDMPEVMDTLGWVHYKRGQPQRAIPFFERCVEKVPASANYRYHLGLAYLGAGDEAKGKAALRRALGGGLGAVVDAEIRRLLES